jgi:hypothetical protein
MKRPALYVLWLALAAVVGGLGVWRLVLLHNERVRAEAVELARDRCHAAVSRSLFERFKATAPEFIVADVRFDPTADWTVRIVGIVAVSDVDRKESLYDYECSLSHYDATTGQWSALAMSV